MLRLVFRLQVNASKRTEGADREVRALLFCRRFLDRVKALESSRNRHSISLRKPLDQRRHGIIRQMIEELARRMESDSTLRTSGYDDALAPLGYARWLINKVGKIVTLNLALDRSEQFGLEHGTLRFGSERNGRRF
jgi:hypothetical protein